MVRKWCLSVGLAVGRLDDIVFLLEDHAQHRAVDRLIIDDQDETPAVGGMELFMALEHRDQNPSNCLQALRFRN